MLETERDKANWFFYVIENIGFITEDFITVYRVSHEDMNIDSLGCINKVNTFVGYPIYTHNTSNISLWNIEIKSTTHTMASSERTLRVD